MKPTELSGIVTRFNGNGRKFGYPTANLRIASELNDGVYFGYADLESFTHHPALIFIGTPTTVGDKERRIEVHLLDIPDKDYYSHELKVSVEYYHRPNQTFPNIKELLGVMAEDEKQARRWFSESSNGNTQI